MKEKRRIPLPVLLFIVVAILFIIVGGIYFAGKNEEKGVACTMEALICPDGTAVDRVGPNCEFAPCPTQTK